MKSFAKGSAIGPTVTISMSEEKPIAIEYPIEQFGTLRYYLAPKIDDGD